MSFPIFGFPLGTKHAPEQTS